MPPRKPATDEAATTAALHLGSRPPPYPNHQRNRGDRERGHPTLPPGTPYKINLSTTAWNGHPKWGEGAEAREVPVTSIQNGDQNEPGGVWADYPRYPSESPPRQGGSSSQGEGPPSRGGLSGWRGGWSSCGRAHQSLGGGMLDGGAKMPLRSGVRPGRVPPHGTKGLAMPLSTTGAKHTASI